MMSNQLKVVHIIPKYFILDDWDVPLYAITSSLLTFDVEGIYPSFCIVLISSSLLLTFILINYLYVKLYFIEKMWNEKFLNF